MAAVTVTGTVTKAYNPKRGSSKFFFMVDDGENEYKGMAYLDCLELIHLGAKVKITGWVRGEWLNPTSVELLEEPKIEARAERLFIGHVGHPKVTAHGFACYAKAGDEWVVIPVSVIAKFFEGDENVVCAFPNRGQCVLDAMVKRNGQVVVQEILGYSRNTVTIDLDVPFSEIRWYSDAAVISTVHGALRVKVGDLPFDVEPEILSKLPTMDATLHLAGTMVAYSLGLGRVEWEVEFLTVTASGETIGAVEHLVWNDKVARATAAVRDELKDLIETGVVVDVDSVMAMFLNQGLDVDREKAESLLTRGYDVRYLKALQEMSQGGRCWACTDGFFVEMGEWVVWERCVAGAATYILPKAPNTDVTGELTTVEWVSVLGRILPGANKMALRYGEVGQALSGHECGVRFAIHAEDEDGNFDGWMEAIAGAVAKSPGAEVGGLPTLESLGLLLAA